jgi:integrase
MTGLHVSEIERIAAGEGLVEPVEDGGEIAGKVTVRHKSGRTHVQAVGAQCFATLERIQKRGKIPAAAAWVTCLKRAARDASKETGKKIERVLVANLRHTFVTLARQRGRLVYAKGTEGVPLSIVAQIVGHTDEKTTKTFYDASELPPLLVIPLGLIHPGDPAVRMTKAKMKKSA